MTKPRATKRLEFSGTKGVLATEISSNILPMINGIRHVSIE